MDSLATLAAMLLLVAGVIHNYSFMCRKIPRQNLKRPYPKAALGQLLLDLSWLAMAISGLLLCFRISAALCLLAAGIYFLLLPFLLQPQLARLLGFSSLRDYVDSLDQQKKS